MHSDLLMVHHDTLPIGNVSGEYIIQQVVVNLRNMVHRYTTVIALQMQQYVVFTNYL